MPIFDLVAAVALTASASIIVGMLAASYPGSSTARMGVGAALGIWFGMIVVLGGIGAFDDVRGIGAPGLGIAVLLPVLVMSYAGTRVAALKAAVAGIPLTLLVGVNAVRVLGVVFVLLYADGRLSAPFAPVAGWGDILIGVTALPVAWAVARRADGWRLATLVWNALGLIDLVAAVGLGVTSAPGSPLRLFFAGPGTDIMSGLPWVIIPGFVVPILMLTHLAVFHRMVGRRFADQCASSAQPG